MDFGIVSLIPAAIAIILSLVTREVILSLFFAVLAGAFIISGDLFVAFTDTLNKYLIGSLAGSEDTWNLSILVFCLTIGGLIQLIEKNGGSKGIGDLIVKKAVNTKSTLLSTWLLGFAIFFDDYANSLIVGNTMRGITDKMGISREKLAYIIDSTAAPVSSMALISTWIGMELGLIKAGFEKLGIEGSAYSTFLASIPFRFYSVLALIFVGIMIFTGKDFGPMAKAERVARANRIKEQVEAHTASNETNRWYNAVVPITAVILITMIGLFYNGGGFEGKSIQDAFGDADASVVLLWASIGGFIIAAIMSLIQGQFKIKEVMDIYTDGIKSMVAPGMILCLAWALSSVNGDLDTASYIVSFIGDSMPAFLVPTLMFLVPAVIAFSTGTSWGANSIVMPIAISLAYATGGEALLVPTIGAVLTGAVLGDHISPISDTTIMSSMASGCDHIAHVRTQIPYALTVAVVAIFVGFIPAGLGLNPWISLAIAVPILVAIMHFFGKSTDQVDASSSEQAA